MNWYDLIKLNYLRASYAQAEAEGKVPQWLFKQFLYWLLRTIFFFFFLLLRCGIKLLASAFKCVIIMPFGRMWEITGRKCQGMDHLLRFCGLAIFYYVFVFTAIVTVLQAVFK